MPQIKSRSIHFVVPPEFSEELKDLENKHANGAYPYWLGGRFNWVAQSWLVLREFREGLTIGTTPVPGQINFGHVMFWRGRQSRGGEFRVSVRADYPRMFDVDFEVLQNPAAQLSDQQAYLPYWPVPGLKPRDSSRTQLRTVAYAGRMGPLNLAEGLKDASMLLPDGIEMRIIPPHKWHDLSEVDALVAIRSFDKKLHVTKPPSKLFSAWLGNVPLIAGFDSAFSEIGVPGQDYLRISTAQELYTVLEQLRDDRNFYDYIVRNGINRAVSVSHEEIANLWLDTLDTQVVAAFERWKDTPQRRLRNLMAHGLDVSRTTGSRVKRAFKVVQSS